MGDRATWQGAWGVGWRVRVWVESRGWKRISRTSYTRWPLASITTSSRSALVQQASKVRARHHGLCLAHSAASGLPHSPHVRGGLVDGGHDGAAGSGERLQRGHHHERVERVEPARGFVQPHHL
jgi:hypothetical protein